jgi:hypothetical protein
MKTICDLEHPRAKVWWDAYDEKLVDATAEINVLARLIYDEDTHTGFAITEGKSANMSLNNLLFSFISYFRIP